MTKKKTYNFDDHYLGALQNYHPKMRIGDIHSLDRIIKNFLSKKKALTAEENVRVFVAKAGSEKAMQNIINNTEKYLQDYIRKYGEDALVKAVGNNKYAINYAVSKPLRGNINLSTPNETNVILKIKQLEHAAGLPLPAYQTKGSAGMDLTAAENMLIKKGERVLVPTGLAMEIPPGYEGQVRPRSGLASKHGITVLNAPGTIDSDYRGEVKVMLINLGYGNDGEFAVLRGDRIAQLIIAPYARCEIAACDDVGNTERGSGGFGSTGK